MKWDVGNAFSQFFFLRKIRIQAFVYKHHCTSS